MYFPSASFDCLPPRTSGHQHAHTNRTRQKEHSQNLNGVQRHRQDVRRERQNGSRDARRVPPVHVARARCVCARAGRRPRPARPPRVGCPGGL